MIFFILNIQISLCGPFHHDWCLLWVLFSSLSSHATCVAFKSPRLHGEVEGEKGRPVMRTEKLVPGQASACMWLPTSTSPESQGQVPGADPLPRAPCRDLSQHRDPQSCWSDSTHRLEKKGILSGNIHHNYLQIISLTSSCHKPWKKSSTLNMGKLLTERRDVTSKFQLTLTLIAMYHWISPWSLLMRI